MEHPSLALQERHLALAVKKTGKPSHNLGTGFTLLYGGVAGVAAETAVYPLQIVQRYMQVHSKAGAQRCWCCQTVASPDNKP